MSKTVVKKYRYILVLCVQLLVILCLAGCGPAAPVFMHDRTEIEKIEIVEAYYDANTDAFVQDLLVSINDVDAFLNELHEVECHRYWGGPFGLVERTTAVKIIYKNGDYEAFSWAGRAEYTASDDIYRAYKDRGVHFDLDGFNELLKKYLGYYPFEE